jgi:hypothetical protein
LISHLTLIVFLLILDAFLIVTNQVIHLDLQEIVVMYLMVYEEGVAPINGIVLVKAKMKM